MLTNPKYSCIFRILPDIGIKMATLSFGGVGSEGTYFVLPLEIWNICSFQVFWTPPYLPCLIKDH